MKKLFKQAILIFLYSMMFPLMPMETDELSSIHNPKSLLELATDTYCKEFDTIPEEIDLNVKEMMLSKLKPNKQNIENLLKVAQDLNDKAKIKECADYMLSRMKIRFNPHEFIDDITNFKDRDKTIKEEFNRHVREDLPLSINDESLPLLTSYESTFDRYKTNRRFRGRIPCLCCLCLSLAGWVVVTFFIGYEFSTSKVVLRYH